MAWVEKLKPGRWQVRWSVYAEGRRGHRKRNFASAAEAGRFRALKELEERRGVGSVRMTLREYLDGWLNVKEGDVERNTLAGYRRWVEHALRGAVAAMAIDRISPLHLEDLYRYLLTTPAGRSRPLSPVSVRHVATVLATALRDAVRQKLIPDNPAMAAKRPRGQSPRVAAPNAEQLTALLADFERHNPAMLDLAILLITSACRRSEALGLRWQDVDFAAASICIRQAVIEHDGQWSIRKGTKSIAGQRGFRLPEVTVEALRRQQVRVAEARLKLGRFWRDHDLVFPDEASGGPRAPASITKAFTRAASRVARMPCGWPADASPVHSLRHAAATLALAAGVDIGTLSARLGHSSAAITARIYIHGVPDKDTAVAEVMAVPVLARLRQKTTA